ncbi:hypothetical protein GEOBRER4_n0387 [Citrifermentans bremense]|uniref:Uncharacterized protein n=1 Tax=Citrifermentans bremense TaxID=60035 RepID=A0A7R7FSQ2_9BACT|nr:hypothetical protein GEOBRER4_n0387 [Citrifermentans bremense]
MSTGILHRRIAQQKFFPILPPILAQGFDVALLTRFTAMLVSINCGWR